MKGIIILTSDERAYRQGAVIETGAFIHPPTREDITYIEHLRKVTEKEIKRWLDIVGYRLVIVIDKLPTLSSTIKEEIIIDKSLLVGKPNHKKQIDALFRWADRQRVHSAFKGMPIPLAVSFLRENKKGDMHLWRLLADVQYTLRESDVYWKEIINADKKVRNTVRSENIERLPKSVKKRKEKVLEWF